MQAETSLYDLYLAALLKGDRSSCRQIINDMLAEEVEVKFIYLNFFQRSLYEIGEMWADNQVSVAVEHCATAITESLLPLVYSRIFMADHHGKKAIISCVSNEFHQIGGKMVADIMEMHGWDTSFQGAGTTLMELLLEIEGQPPDLVGLSLGISANLSNLFTAVATIRERFPGLTIIVGGQGLRTDAARRELAESLPEVKLITSLDQLEQFMGVDNGV